MLPDGAACCECDGKVFWPVAIVRGWQYVDALLDMERNKSAIDGPVGSAIAKLIHTRRRAVAAGRCGSAWNAGQTRTGIVRSY